MPYGYHMIHIKYTVWVTPSIWSRIICKEINVLKSNSVEQSRTITCGSCKLLLPRNVT